jgi:hypothetical protein
VIQRLAVVDADTLRVEDGPGYGGPGEPVRVERGADGSITAVRLAGGLRALPEPAFQAWMGARRRVRRDDG